MYAPAKNGVVVAINNMAKKDPMILKVICKLHNDRIYHCPYNRSDTQLIQYTGRKSDKVPFDKIHII